MRDDDVGVYVHVPFCERVCPYCDFAVVAARQLAAADEDDYVDALLAELAARAGDFAGRRLASLYLGGGTPSLLRPGSVARIVEGVRRAFPPAPDTPPEITLEVNPSTLERERLPAFRSVGVSRVSVGVQSFDDVTLKRLGRAHRAREAHRTLEACRGAGFASISLDLMFAAPGQSQAQLARDLDAALAFGPEHLSAYELTLEPGTPFAAAAARGRLACAPEELAAAMIGQVEARLRDAGYARYEISSYARPGAEARHNQRYWARRPVLGIGVGAVSSEPAAPGRPHGARRANPRTLAAWRAAVRTGRPPPLEVLAPGTARGEAVFLALRTARGLDATAFAGEFGAPPRQFFAAAIDALLREGLLHEAPAGDLALSARGRLLADSVFEHFV